MRPFPDRGQVWLLDKGDKSDRASALSPLALPAPPPSEIVLQDADHEGLVAYVDEGVLRTIDREAVASSPLWTFAGIALTDGRRMTIGQTWRWTAKPTGVVRIVVLVDATKNAFVANVFRGGATRSGITEEAANRASFAFAFFRAHFREWERIDETREELGLVHLAMTWRRVVGIATSEVGTRARAWLRREGPGERREHRQADTASIDARDIFARDARARPAFAEARRAAVVAVVDSVDLAPPTEILELLLAFAAYEDARGASRPSDVEIDRLPSPAQRAYERARRRGP